MIWVSLYLIIGLGLNLMASNELIYELLEEDGLEPEYMPVIRIMTILGWLPLTLYSLVFPKEDRL